MDQISFFKKLVISNFILFTAYSAISAFFESEYITKINDKLVDFESLPYETLILFITILAVALILHVLSFYFLYNLKKIGKYFYTISLFTMIIFDSIYPSAADRLVAFLYFCSLISSGGILALMYFTNISSKFK
jgi:hypothetical protein